MSERLHPAGGSAAPPATPPGHPGAGTADVDGQRRVDSAPPPQANPPVRRRGGPRVPGPVETLGMGWGWLRRMRTALYLLGVLGLLTIVATVVPQEPNVPATVRAWRAGTEGPASATGALEVPGQLLESAIVAIGGYDVFGSPAFLLLLALLFVSLTGCLIPRYRAWWRLARRSQPPRTRNLARQERHVTFTTDRSPAEAHSVAREVLAARRWRLRRDPRDPEEPDADQVAAERGHLLREGGSLLFHTSFYLLLIGVVVGQLFGFSGQVAVVEGKSWAETAVGYWTTDAGRFWSPGNHRGFVLTLDRFEVDWRREGPVAGQPSTFLSHVTIEEPDGRRYEATVGGNDPLMVDGMKVHQLDWGYAPRVVVRDDGQVVHDAFIPMQAADAAGIWQGVVKAPAAEPDVGLDLLFAPSAPESGNGPAPTGAPWVTEPALQVTVLRGDLQLDRAQNFDALDTTRLEAGERLSLRGGEEVRLPDGVTVAFPEWRRWVGFQVGNKPTLPLLLAAAGLVLIGLLAALYASRRRLWVQARPDPESGRTTVEAAGRAFQRREAFAGEFERLVGDLRRRLDADDHPSPTRSTDEAVRT